MKIFVALFCLLSLHHVALADLSMPTINAADVEAEVRRVFSDALVMVDIAKCESAFRQLGNEFMPLRGGNGKNYIGVFQISEQSAAAAKERGMDIYTLEGNVAYARVMYEARGTEPWVVCTKTSPTVKNQALTVGATQPLTANLQSGMTNPQVKVLQKLLNNAGFVIALTGPGSPGNETNIFGDLTKKALQRFQCEKNITCSGNESGSGYGKLGPRTRAALLAL